MKLIAPVLLGVLVLLTSSAVADTTLAKFKGGIGVIPVSSGQGTAATATVVNRNIVRGVQPPGQIWVIEDLRADVRPDRITVDGRGQLLGGGNIIGRNANQRVIATLICVVRLDLDHTGFQQHSTQSDLGGVALEANGDFRIEDALTPAIPGGVCVSPVLLIRTVGQPTQNWFAAGIPKL